MYLHEVKKSSLSVFDDENDINFLIIKKVYLENESFTLHLCNF